MQHNQKSKDKQQALDGRDERLVTELVGLRNRCMIVLLMLECLDATETQQVV